MSCIRSNTAYATPPDPSFRFAALVKSIIPGESNMLKREGRAAFEEATAPS